MNTHARIQDVDKMDGLLNRAVHDDPEVRSGVLQITAPSFSWSGARGFADPQTAKPMCPDDQFQIAGITKIMTATTLLLLAEEGRLDLDAGIGSCLPAAVTEGLHVIAGYDYGPHITPRQLLSHTSGLADFFGDGEARDDGVMPFVAQMNARPDTLWEPYEIVDWTSQNLKSRFPPGEGWHYSDTGLLLAGLIIEHVTGAAYHRVLRARLFDPLDMPHTYLLFREPIRSSVTWRRVSRAFTGGSGYGDTRSVTAHWGSGGLVSTAADLKRFIRAMADNRVFRDPATRAQMLTLTPTGEPGVSYGLGVRHFDLAALGMPGAGELWGHTGFLKSFMLYWPQQDATICGTLNQSQAQGVFSELRPVAALVADVLKELRRRTC